MTKKVVDIHAKAIVDVPVDAIECSVCGCWKPSEAYRKETESKQSRTNCADCYNMGWDDMRALSESTRALREKLSSKLYCLNMELDKTYELDRNSIPVQELIQALQRLPSTARVCMTQDGYYADGDYGDVYTDFDKVGEINGQEVFSIGHSSQNY